MKCFKCGAELDFIPLHVLDAVCDECAALNNPLSKKWRGELMELRKAVEKVLEYNVHVNHCPATLYGNGSGPCDCEVKELRELTGFYDRDDL